MKKSRFLRKLVSVFLAGTMILNGVTASGETGESNSLLLEDVFSFNSVVNYIDDIIPSYIYASELDVSNGYCVSNPIPVYNLNKMEVIGYRAFVVVDNMIKGEISVYASETGLSSVYRDGVREEISTAFLNNSSICYGVYNDCLVLCVDGDSFINLNNIGTSKNVISDISSYCSKIEINNTISNDTFMSLIFAENISRATQRVTLDVDLVENDTSVNSKGICWAACIAMKVNFLNGNNNLTALSIYNYLKNNGYAYDGSVACARTAYAHYDVSFNNGTTVTNQFIWNQLNAQNPVEICINGYRYDSNDNLISNEKDYHQVLIVGMTILQNSVTYKIKCPNGTTNQNIFISLSGSAEQLMVSDLSTINYVDDHSLDDGKYIVFSRVYRTYW